MQILDEEGRSLPSQDDKNMGLLVHLISFSSMVFPLGNIIGPLIVWMIKKDQSEFVDKHGKESLNFQITTTLVMIVAIVLGIFMAVGSGMTDNEVGIAGSIIAIIAFVIGYSIFILIVVIVAAIKANNGEYFRYPFSIRFIS